MNKTYILELRDMKKDSKRFVNEIHFVPTNKEECTIQYMDNVPSLPVKCTIKHAREKWKEWITSR